jgi:hypothetical protein
MAFWNRKRVPFDAARAQPPWDARPSIYGHIRAHISPGGRGLTEGGDRLPDEDSLDPHGPRWVAGGLDGAFGRHGNPEGRDAAAALGDSLERVLEDASPSNLKKLYDMLLAQTALEVVDPLVEGLPARSRLDLDRLAALAEWIARNAPDREPVKAAIALRGALSGGVIEDLFATLGRHEEFTLYAAVAIANSSTQPQRALFELARHVDGWGRIQTVERLAGTDDPEIKRWLLREGFRNLVMHEYLAYTCATSGGLLAELRADAIDEPLLVATGEILFALIAGGPAEDLDDYADGAVVVERYLHHLGAAPSRLAELLTIDSILKFVTRERDWSDAEARGWTAERRDAVRARCEALVALPQWKATVDAGLESQDPEAFFEADAAALVLRMDTWDTHYRRLEEGGDGWYQAMRTSDPDRVDRVVALAERRLPLESIASGPANELGLGPAWSAHSGLDFVLQGLAPFPGKGWLLIRAGLRSPVVRNRHMALRALAGWGRDRWPHDCADLLRAALAREMDEDVREAIQNVLDGRSLADPAV